MSKISDDSETDDGMVRCHDDTCPERHDCLRWLRRKIGAGDWQINHVQSLREYPRGERTMIAEPPEGVCRNKVSKYQERADGEDEEK